MDGLMKKTLLALVAGASIGAGTVVTLPDGSKATAEAPTADEIYTEEFVQSVKLVRTADGSVARYIVQKNSLISGVAPSSVAGEMADQKVVFDAVAKEAMAECNAMTDCTWTSMVGARQADEVLTANIANGPIITLTKDVPALDMLKKEILDKE
jgi:hypothetical protein